MTEEIIKDLEEGFEFLSWDHQGITQHELYEKIYTIHYDISCSSIETQPSGVFLKESSEIYWEGELHSITMDNFGWIARYRVSNAI
jgi:hypothetical protein